MELKKSIKISRQFQSSINQPLEFGHIDKEDYLKRIEGLFETDKTKCRGERARLRRILDDMIRWYRLLPQYTLVFQYPLIPIEKENFKKIKKFCELFQSQELNPKEVLFEKIPVIAGEGKGYLYCFERMEEWKSFLDSYEEQAKKVAASQIKELFGYGENDDLAQSLKTWYQKQDSAAHRFLCHKQAGLFLKYIETLCTHDEGEIVNQISKMLQNIFVADWNDESLDLLLKVLKEIKMEVQEI